MKEKDKPKFEVSLFIPYNGESLRLRHETWKGANAFEDSRRIKPNCCKMSKAKVFRLLQKQHEELT